MSTFVHRAAYTYSLVEGVVCVVDLCTGRSVTNDADNVIADLARKGIDLASHPVIYRDTEGRWDQLLVEDNRFAGFAALGGSRERDVAIARLKQRVTQ